MHPDIDRILDRLEKLADLVPDAATYSGRMSRWSIGQHAEHVLRATSAFTVQILRNRTSDGLGIKRPEKDQLLALGAIPRGIAEAPDGTRPGPNPTEKDLEDLLLKTRKRVRRLAEVDAEAVADHPYLGEMTRDEIFRFLVIHLDHHLRIMQEIRGGSGR